MGVRHISQILSAQPQQAASSQALNPRFAGDGYEAHGRRGACSRSLPKDESGTHPGAGTGSEWVVLFPAPPPDPAQMPPFQLMPREGGGYLNTSGVAPVLSAQPAGISFSAPTSSPSQGKAQTFAIW